MMWNICTAGNLKKPSFFLCLEDVWCFPFGSAACATSFFTKSQSLSEQSDAAPSTGGSRLTPFNTDLKKMLHILLQTLKEPKLPQEVQSCLVLFVSSFRIASPIQSVTQESIQVSVVLSPALLPDWFIPDHPNVHDNLFCLCLIVPSLCYNVVYQLLVLSLLSTTDTFQNSWQVFDKTLRCARSLRVTE